jgi:hypothetical protein
MGSALAFFDDVAHGYCTRWLISVGETPHHFCGCLSRLTKNRLIMNIVVLEMI